MYSSGLFPDAKEMGAHFVSMSYYIVLTVGTFPFRSIYHPFRGGKFLRIVVPLPLAEETRESHVEGEPHFQDYPPPEVVISNVRVSTCPIYRTLRVLLSCKQESLANRNVPCSWPNLDGRIDV